MREILTVLAGLVILALTTLLAVPPLVDWTAHRDWVDATISRAVGQPARTAGALDLRLLPVPRLRAERLRLGSGRPDAPLLDAAYLRAEVALTPLIGGEVKLQDARVGRVEIRLPTGAGGDWRVPRRLVAGALARRDWSIEDLSVQQLLVTTLDPNTGRTDQAYADAVRIGAQSLAGPWRLEGRMGGVPFEVAGGELGPDNRASLKVGAGGAGLPRFDLDGRLELIGDGLHEYRPRVTGLAKLATTARPGSAAGPAQDERLPATAQASLVAAGRSLDLSDIALEVGDGASTLRLTGSGAFQLDPAKLSLTLSGRRFDLPAFLAANLSRLPDNEAAGAVPLDLSVALDGLVVPNGELSAVTARLGLDEKRLRLEGLRADLPGGGTLALSGTLDLDRLSGQGSLALSARQGDRIAPLLSGLGLDGLAAGLDGRPLAVSADATLAPPVISVRNVRAALGDTHLTGTARWTDASGGGRPRLDAQLALRALDLDVLGDGAWLFRAARTVDLGVSVDARGVRFEGSGDGRISGRIATDGPALLMEGLEVRDLAGAEASLSGRIGPDGSGRIAGRVTAPRAAPLLDLFGPAWLGEAARFVPDVVRNDAVDLTVGIDKADAGAPGFRTTLTGRLGDGRFEATTATASGRINALAVAATTDTVASWFAGEAAAAGLRGPGRMTLGGTREPDGRFRLSVAGSAAGVALTTEEPLAVEAGAGWPSTGALRVRADDASPVLPLLTGLAPGSVVPIDLRLEPGPSPRSLSASGRLAGADAKARLTQDGSGTVTGELALSRVSLPALVRAFGLGPVPSTAGTWSSARFAALGPRRFLGTVQVSADSVAIGPDLMGRDGRFALAVTESGLAVRDLAVSVRDGTVAGSLSVERQGGQASLIGDGTVRRLPLGLLLAAPLDGGSLDGALKFGASGESLAALVSNLGGAGSLTLDGLTVAKADPGAPAQAATQAIRSDDPLASTQWLPILRSALDRGALVAKRAEADVSLTSGSLRAAPLTVAAATGTWSGSATVDLRGLTLDIRGALTSSTAPRRWPEGRPTIGLGWNGPASAPARTIDAAPLVNGLATAVLQRELDRIDTFDRDAAERARLNARTEMGRQRRLAAEEAARQEAARQEAARQEAARQEAARQARQRDEARQRDDAKQRGDTPPVPLDIRPPAQLGTTGG